MTKDLPFYTIAWCVACSEYKYGNGFPVCYGLRLLIGVKVLFPENAAAKTTFKRLLFSGLCFGIVKVWEETRSWSESFTKTAKK